MPTIRHTVLGIATWTLVGGLLLSTSSDAPAAAPNPRERVDYWRSNYTVVTSDARVARAQKIFDRIVRAAGQRPGVEPRLLVIAENPANVSLPIAIPDGWIILSLRTLDFCYRMPAYGDDRLAFVLAHEVTHQMEDDFWHMKFFQAIEALGARGNERQVFTEVQDMARLTDKTLARELRADELGMTYAMMAGFNPEAILGGAGTDFFKEWVTTLDPARLRAAPAARTHPEPAHRVAAVKARLHQVSEQAELFQLGLLFYQATDFRNAALAFEEFRRYFPGREAQHNLGAAYHQLALQQWRPTSGRNEPFFKLSVAIDPLTRAYRNVRNASGNMTESFQRNIAFAIENYRRAIALDARYLPAYRNLASAYIARGEPYQAIAILQEALKFAPNDAAVLNNLGVAFFYAGNVREAADYLNRAHQADPNYDAPLFNLGSVAQREGDTAEAKRHWLRYLDHHPDGDWATVLRTRYQLSAVPKKPSPAPGQEPETLLGVEIGAYEKELPETWGTPTARALQLNAPLRVARYANGIATIAQDGEIRWMSAAPTYPGTSRRGVRVGSARADVEARYGVPTYTLATTLGESLVYPAYGITFNVQEQRVVSWLLYWD